MPKTVKDLLRASVREEALVAVRLWNQEELHGYWVTRVTRDWCWLTNCTIVEAGDASVRIPIRAIAEISTLEP